MLFRCAIDVYKRQSMGSGSVSLFLMIAFYALSGFFQSTGGSCSYSTITKWTPVSYTHLSVNNLTVFQVMMLYCLSFSSKCDLPRIFIRKKNFPLSPL